ncbi:Tat pathway signal sequence domain protein [Mangrovactinospora gilvigrisea]|uniref:Tat pathway signal sequence domain protein n=1 Tax=Mangrovactinospora gilvigrisea TaxID=1428644 RepID=A0A1J7BB29_9ACTN|nr:Tat pathway signal sequence domain protein [Mangrovactinospora gilvigrisea]OIV35813.1 Tat pathway signal sequence domain protein [Mangrovactinospora gilvigrisea]
MTADTAPWRSALADADMVWQRIPTTWYEGPFLGNGGLGSGIYAEPAEPADPANADRPIRRLRFNVQHSEVQDHRPRFGTLWGLARLPIGHFTLTTAGDITALDWRLDLWNAELTGTVTTTAGILRLRALVHAERDVLTVRLTPGRGESAATWTWTAAEAISPRVHSPRPRPTGYTGNDPAVLDGDQSFAVTAHARGASVQHLLAGGGHTTAWRQTVAADGTATLAVGLAHAFPGDAHPAAAAALVEAEAEAEADADTAAHRAWWHAFYPKSFLSVPDARLQAFYWIQLYKTASATRRDRPVMATCGPWLEPTPWPATWWNLNVQLEYWLIQGSNHIDQLDSLTRALAEHADRLGDALAPAYRADGAGLPRTTDIHLAGGGPTDGTDPGHGVGVPGEADPTPEIGNLAWALHNVWLTYRHTMDEALLRDTVFPLLRRCVAYYLRFLAAGPDGFLHLPLTYSPEYGTATDVNYDLALIRWGCATLLDAARVLGVDDPSAAAWEDTLKRLTPYPVDGTGLMIGAGTPLATSHRHYSHLLMIFPLHLMTWEQPEHRALIERSLAHWVGFTGALQGYTFTGAASIAAGMGDGDRAQGYLEQLLAEFIKPNTMYQESGPVIETPLSAVRSLQDMVCQSWGGVLRLFPAVPSAWDDVRLQDFRTEGAFLLAAERRAGRTAWMRIRSEAGAPCVLRSDLGAAVEVRDADGRTVPHETLDNGDLRLHLAAGEEALVHPAGTPRPSTALGPVAPGAPAARWGLPA